MRKLLLFLTISLLSNYTFSQTEDAWVFFKDKPEASTYLSNPTSMLTQRSIDRRTRLNIALDTKDVPIHSSYYDQVKNTSGITVMAKSKWLNAIHVRGTQTIIDGLSTSFSFIEKIEFANKSLNRSANVSSETKESNHVNKFEGLHTDFDYGVANTQVTMIKADYLHQQGFTGEGIHMAVIDAGFPNVQSLSAFQRLRDNNKILGGYDFVNRSSNFYTGHNHGTHVLSDIAGYIENQFVGTAPDASFYLFVTEDTANETPLEESLWVEAAERADSLGVDVVNTSLGYTTFDNSSYNYNYNDMDGETAFISRGAEIGASRGVIFVTSAGNSGAQSWRYVSAPADAASVFTIGAVNAAENIASFSSYGPTADGRVKPDVLAHGQSVYVINYISGSPSTSNGTSFSSPVMAGAVACFWQAFPDLTHIEIMQKIRESADRYTNPTDQHGYGVPDFEQAYRTLSTEKLPNENEITVYPNPVENTVFIDSQYDKVNVSIINLLGEFVKKEEGVSEGVNVSNLSQGMYILQIEKDGLFQKIKFLKQ
ncbi:Por secretion system C-terminal sorting domain-containing protein [Tenacibaculum sp. MAR_2009_124]|uniref:S8 family serine peptidase n=1 Tax=Tenacibaculum sp. MAR_2009_124 TaxID=1250059 RepID=UPI0008979B4F|nr:S8 family serine peptidase [Tenacibaculum sp. MAR_2009_124]SEB40553.1 Por secretion system C-terminal sorting domain-containing protein [Tenacibaculum sp. MAR_2009_124]